MLLLLFSWSSPSSSLLLLLLNSFAYTKCIFRTNTVVCEIFTKSCTFLFLRSFVCTHNKIKKKSPKRKQQKENNSGIKTRYGATHSNGKQKTKWFLCVSIFHLHVFVAAGCCCNFYIVETSKYETMKMHCET